MKRLLLIAIMFSFIGTMSFAQDATTTILLNYKTLSKKAESSDMDIVHAKKSLKASTWMKRGNLFQDIDNQGLEQVQLGMGTTEIKLFYGNPINLPEVNEDNVETYEYETIHYLFENGRLRGWTRVDPISENPLRVALDCYKKAIDLTEAEKQEKYMQKMLPKLDELKDQFKRSGQNRYYLEDYAAALADFEAILEINELPVYKGVVDTLMTSYCGIVAREIGRINSDNEMYKKAISYYSKLADIGSGGSTTYLQMTRDFYAMGDTLGAIENLKKGLEQYPDSSVLVTVAAQAYYLMDANEDGLAFVDERLKQKPDCPAAYYWKGLLITNAADVDEETIQEALKLYEKSLELDPSNANVWYQTGYVYYAVGANYFEQESYEDDGEYRDELTAKGTENYEKAAVNLERTYEVSEGDPTLQKESLDLLKRIYYKLYGGDDDRYLNVTTRLNQL